MTMDAPIQETAKLNLTAMAGTELFLLGHELKAKYHRERKWSAEDKALFDSIVAEVRRRVEGCTRVDVHMPTVTVASVK